MIPVSMMHSVSLLNSLLRSRILMVFHWVKRLWGPFRCLSCAYSDSAMHEIRMLMAFHCFKVYECFLYPCKDKIVHESKILTVCNWMKTDYSDDSLEPAVRSHPSF